MHGGTLVCLNRGVTILRGESGYSRSERTMLFIAVNRRRSLTLCDLVSQVAPDAFLVISLSNEVVGRVSNR